APAQRVRGPMRRVSASSPRQDFRRPERSPHVGETLRPTAPRTDARYFSSSDSARRFPASSLVATSTLAATAPASAFPVRLSPSRTAAASPDRTSSLHSQPARSAPHVARRRSGASTAAASLSTPL